MVLMKKLLLMLSFAAVLCCWGCGPNNTVEKPENPDPPPTAPPAAVSPPDPIPPNGPAK